MILHVSTVMILSVFHVLGHEVPRGTDITNGEPDTPLVYQESEGVFLIEKFDAEKSVVISDRHR